MNATLGYLIALEASTAVWLLCLYKKSTTGWAEFLHRPAGRVLLVTTLIVVGLAALVIREYVRSRRAGGRTFHLAMVTNLLTVTFILGLGEAAVRLIADDSLGSTAVRGMGTEIDLLAVENCVADKADQDATLRKRYEGAFALD